ncbi:MAG: hypothetical protein GW949_09040 [Spirochaetales bacterium]|nr:hypothetical protein [Spirochaetales bacterium]
MAKSPWFRFTTTQATGLDRATKKLLVDLGGIDRSFPVLESTPGRFLGSVEKLLRAEDTPLVVHSSDLGFLDALERNFALEPGLAWVASTDIEVLRSVLFVLRRSWILGKELESSAVFFDSLFHSGSILRFILSANGGIENLNLLAQDQCSAAVQRGSDFAALPDYPPGILNDMLDRARVLSQVQGDFSLRLPEGTRRFSGLFSYFSADESGESQPHFLVCMSDFSDQERYNEGLYRRLEEEGTLAVIAARLIPHTPAVPDRLRRTLEDIASLTGARRVRIVLFPTPMGNLLAPHLASDSVSLDYFSETRVDDFLEPHIESLMPDLLEHHRKIEPIQVGGLGGSDIDALFGYPLWVPGGIVGAVLIQSSPSRILGERSLGLRTIIEMISMFLSRLEPETRLPETWESLK